MSSSPFFSVIMPVYNVERYLDAAINSVLSQTFHDFELILVNDGSTDSSGAIAHQYQKLDSRVRLIWQENAGLSAARNTGLEHAQGCYVYFLDSDDMIDKKTLRHVFKLISKNKNPDVISFNAMPFLDDDFPPNRGEELLREYQQIYEQTYLKDGRYAGQELYLRRTKAHHFLSNVALLFIRRLFLQEINLKFVDGILHEDEVFSRYLFIHARSIVYTNKKLYQRRIRNGSIMHSKVSEHKLISLLVASEKIYALYQQNGLSELELDSRWLYNYAFELWGKQSNILQPIEYCLFDSPLFLRELRQIVPVGRAFTMLVPSFLSYRYLNSIYQPLTTMVLSQYILKDSIFIDIGAGLGYFSLIAATQSKAQKVISIEPSTNAFEVLSKNVNLNQLEQITLFNRSLLLEQGQSAEPDVFLSSLFSSLFAHNDLNLFLRISSSNPVVATLSALRQHIQYAFPKIRLVIEYSLKNTDAEMRDLFDMLFSLNFDIFVLDEMHQIIRKVSTDIPETNFQDLLDSGNSTGMVNFLCLPRQPISNVLVFSHSSSINGGAERSLIALLADFTYLGIVPTVVLPSRGPLEQYLHEIGTITIIFPFGWWSANEQISNDEGQAWLAKNFQAVQDELVPLIGRVNPDVVLTNTTVIPWGSICAFLINKPHIWYVRELGLPEYGINYFYPSEMIKEYIKGGSNLVITNSFFTKNTFLGESASLRFEVIYPLLDVNLRKLPVEAQKFFQQDDSFKLACLGGILPGKGQADAIYALKELISDGEKVEIVFAGDIISSEYYNTLLRLVQEFELSAYVHFVGFIEFPYSLYTQADAILVCSRNEAFGRVTLEAMHLGKPLIAAGSGGTLELVEDEQDGLLYSAGDIAHLVEKISRLIREPQTMVRLGRKAAEKARTNFSREAAVQKFHKALRAVAGEESQVSPKFFYMVLDLEKKNREIQLAEIYSSRGWRLLQILRRVRWRLLPAGSRREGFARFVFRALRAVKRRIIPAL